MLLKNKIEANKSKQNSAVLNFFSLKSLKHINKYFYKYRWRLLLGILFVGVSNYFAVDSFSYAREAVDYIKNNYAQDKSLLMNQLLQ